MPDIIKDALDLVLGNSTKAPPKTKKELLGAHEATELTDKEIIAHPPEATNYDSMEGSIIIQKVKYFHGDLLPNGKRANCPLLNDDEWANLFETFSSTVMIMNKRTGKLENYTENKPAILSDLDRRFMFILNNNDRILLKAYRDARKSANLQRRVKRLILDKHLCGIYYSSTAKKARQFTMKIRHQLKTNANILRYYGYVIDEEQGDRKEELFFMWQTGASRDPGCSTGSIEGSSGMGLHPDWIAVDDPCEEGIEGSDIKIETLINWFTKQVVPMVTPFTYLYVVGTPKDPHDVYAYIQETNMYKVENIQAILTWPNGGQTKGGTVGDPNRWFYATFQMNPGDKPLIRGVQNLRGGLVSFDQYFRDSWVVPGRIPYFLEDDEKKGLDCNRMAMQEFLLRLQEMGIDSFNSEMQMLTIKIGEGFLQFDARLQYFNPLGMERPQDLNNCMVAFFDQAYGDSPTAANNCVVICSKFEEKYYIIDAYLWKSGIGGFLDKAEHVIQIYRAYPQIRAFSVESGQSNSADAKNMILILQKENIPIAEHFQNNYKLTLDEDEAKTKVNMKEIAADLHIKATDKGKIFRIVDQWSPRLTTHKIYMNERLDPEVLAEFNAEKAFPKCKRFDFIDACGSAMDLADSIPEESVMYAEYSAPLV